MPRHPAPTRWEKCSLCGDIFPPEELIPVADVIPGRKRGWICDYPTVATIVSCAKRRGWIGV